jgi:hypothetical protein
VARSCRDQSSISEIIIICNYFYCFENRVLRIFGPKRDELKRKWRKLHNEEFNNLYSSPNIVQLIKWRRIRWPGHVARMGIGEAYTGFWW